MEVNSCRGVFLGLLILLLSSSLVFCAETAGKIYLMELGFKGENLTLHRVYVSEGYAPDRKIQPEDGYRCDVVSFSGQVLYSFRFEFGGFIMPPPPLPGEEPGAPIAVEEGNTTLIMPYFSDAKWINIYDKSGKQILSVDVSGFSDRPPEPEAPADESGADASGTEENIPSGDSGNPIFLYAGIGIVILLILAALAYLLKKKSKGQAAQSGPAPAPAPALQPETLLK